MASPDFGLPYISLYIWLVVMSGEFCCSVADRHICILGSNFMLGDQGESFTLLSIALTDDTVSLQIGRSFFEILRTLRL